MCYCYSCHLCLFFCRSFSRFVSLSHRLPFIWLNVCPFITTLGDVSLRRDGSSSLASTSDDDTATVTSHLTATAAANPCGMPRARVVLAPPCAEWLPGVEVITGHDHGHIYIWKLHIAPRNISRSLLPPSLSSSLSATTLDPNHSELNHEHDDKEVTMNMLGNYRQLLAFPLPGPQLTSTTNNSKGTKSSSSSSFHHPHPQSNPNPHRASITVLRVLSTNPTRTKEFADRSFHLTSGIHPYSME